MSWVSRVAPSEVVDAWRSRALPERLIFLLLLLYALMCPLTIGGAQACAALAFLLWVIRFPARRPGRLAAPQFVLPLVLLIALSLLSIVFSLDPVESLWSARNLLLFLVVPLVLWNVESAAEAVALLAALAAGALVTTAWGAVQVLIGAGGGEAGRRLTGFLGHYMTAGGELMLASLALLAAALWARRRGPRVAAAAAATLLVVGLGLTQSRNAYVGLAVGVVALLLLWRPGLVALLPFALSLAVLVSPPLVRERIFSIADLEDASIRHRLGMVSAGARITADFPLFGAGLQQVEEIYPRYKRPPESADVAHLHNNVLQIAAERGIPTALVWLWLIGALAWGHWRLARDTARPPSLRAFAVGGFAAVAAMFAAGMFEYNFGDSEVLMLFLMLVTLPYAIGAAAARAEEKA